jgi:hypothetical protein
MERKYRWLSLLSCLCGVMFWVEAPAIATVGMIFRQVSANQSQGLSNQPVPVLDVSPLWGLNISFIPSGELIQQVRLGDPSRLLVDFDSPLGESAQDSSRNQQITGATIVYLRELEQPLNLSLRLTTEARSTNSMPMSVVTLDRLGNRHLHQFLLRLGQEYSTVEVVPDLVLQQRRLAERPRRTPILLRPTPWNESVIKLTKS